MMAQSRLVASEIVRRGFVLDIAEETEPRELPAGLKLKYKRGECCIPENNTK